LREEIAHCERRGKMHDACMARYVDLVTKPVTAANSISGIALVGTEIVELTGFSGDQPTAPAGRVRPGKFRKAQVGVNP
jgi:hypothetical protein